MKAWFVFIPGEWGELVHAETKGKAKVNVIHEFGLNGEEFIWFQATRQPKLDDKPFTFQNLQDAKFEWFDEDGKPLREEDFSNNCKCDICKVV